MNANNSNNADMQLSGYVFQEDPISDGVEFVFALSVYRLNPVKKFRLDQNIYEILTAILKEEPEERDCFFFSDSISDEKISKLKSLLTMENIEWRVVKIHKRIPIGPKDVMMTHRYKDEDFYDTTESEGSYLAIQGTSGRYALARVDSITDMLQSVCYINSQYSELESILKFFGYNLVDYERREN